MGCSLTEGVGCFDEELIKNTKLTRESSSEYPNSNEYIEIQKKSLNLFHEHGWPNQVGRALGYDKVINIGKGGSSTSGQLKSFIEIFYGNTLPHYNVTIIWKLTDPSRFSFYSHGRIVNLMLNYDNSGISKEYLNFINDIELDTTLEQVFYIKLMEEFCKSRGYNLVLSHISEHSYEYLIETYKSKHYIADSLKKILPDFNNEIFLSPICYHPSKLGYVEIAKNMVREIKINHPHVVVGNPKETIDWKWCGNRSEMGNLI